MPPFATYVTFLWFNEEVSFEVLDHATYINMYEGHSRIDDNGFISRKVLSYSDLFIMQHEDTDITYSCLKFGAFIMARFDAVII